MAGNPSRVDAKRGNHFLDTYCNIAITLIDPDELASRELAGLVPICRLAALALNFEAIELGNWRV